MYQHELNALKSFQFSFIFSFDATHTCARALTHLPVLRTVAPVCRPGQKTVYSGGRQETIKILCELEANPNNVTFNWKFNASATEFLDLPASQIFPERNNAVAQYTPMTEHVSISILSALCAPFLPAFRNVSFHSCYKTVANHLSTQRKFQRTEERKSFFFFCFFPSHVVISL